MKKRRAFLAVVMILDLCLANACLLAGPVVAPAVAQQSEADVFVAQAILAYDARKYDEALALLKEALALDPKNVEALYYSGLVLMAQQKTEQAVEVLEKARALAPRDLSILFLLGVAYFALERYDQAEGPLTQVFNERPQTEGVGYYVGLIRYRKKDYQGALKAFRAETSKNPNIQQLVKFYSGLTLAILGLPEQAVAEVDAALRVPDRLRAHRPGGANPGLAGRREGRRAAVARRGPRGLPVRQQREGRAAAQPRPHRGVVPAQQDGHPRRDLRRPARVHLAADRPVGVVGRVLVLPDGTTTGRGCRLQRAEPSGVGGPVL